MVRGMEAFCTVCGARRTPFAASILNLAGRPEQLGGLTARAFGWVALGVGLFIALTVGLVVQAIASMFVATTWLGWAVSIPIVLLSLALGVLGIVGGRKLTRAGGARLARAQLQTIRGIARHKKGVVEVGEVARALGIGHEEADAMLTQLAKNPDENVSIDIDDAGNILYLFGSADAIRWRIRAEEAGIGQAEREVLEAESEPEPTAPRRRTL